jgi:hypothetical protein
MAYVISVVFTHDGTYLQAREKATSIEKATRESMQLEAHFNDIEDPQELMEDHVKYLGTFLTREIVDRGRKN